VSWFLTEDAMCQMMSALGISSPTLLFNVPEDKSPLEMDVYEQLVTLARQGWVWKEWIAPSRRTRRTPPLPEGYTPGADTEFFTTLIPSARYLQCILGAQALFEKGCPMVPHGQTDTTYQQLLDGNYDLANIDAAHRDFDVDGEEVVEGEGHVRHVFDGKTLEELLEEVIWEELEGVAESDGSGSAAEPGDIVEPGDVIEGVPEGGDGEPDPRVREGLGDEPVVGVPGPELDDDLFGELDDEPENPLLAALHGHMFFDEVKHGSFGCFLITEKQTGEHGAYQASCKFHRKNAKTACKKLFAVRGPTPIDRVNALRQFMFWCVMARDYDRQRSHMGFNPSLADCPDDETLLALTIETPPDERVPTDIELDAELVGPVPPVVARARGRGRGRAIARGGRGPAVAAAEAPPTPPAAPVAVRSSSSSSAD